VVTLGGVGDPLALDLKDGDLIDQLPRRDLDRDRLSSAGAASRSCSASAIR
jgi:hypothetical protein